MTVRKKSKNTKPSKIARTAKTAKPRLPFKVKIPTQERRHAEMRRAKEFHAAASQVQNLLELVKVSLPILRERVRTLNWRRTGKQFFTANRWTKLFSIVASLFIFFYMKSQDITETNVLIPLNVLANPQLSVSSDVPKNITVFLSGTKDALLSLDENQLTAELDLRAEDEGDVRYKPILRGVPQNVQVLRSSPDVVNVTLSVLNRKLVDLAPQLIGEPHADFYVARVSVKPRRLWISGPQEILTDITSLQTEPIAIENLQANKELTVFLNKSLHPLIQVDRERVISVFLYLRSRFLSETIEGSFPVETGLPRAGLFTQQVITVTNINFEILEEIAENFDPYENFSFLLRTENIADPGNYALEIFVEPVRGVRIKSFSPRRFSLRVQNTADNSTPLLESSVPQ